MKKIILIGLMALLLVGCSSSNSKKYDTVCSSNTNDDMNLKISLERTASDNDLLKSVSIDFEADNSEVTGVLTLISTMLKDIKGLSLTQKDNNFNIIVNFEELDTETLRNLPLPFSSDLAADGIEINDDDVIQRLNELKSHDFLVSSLQDSENFTCK